MSLPLLPAYYGVVWIVALRCRAKNLVVDSALVARLDGGQLFGKPRPPQRSQFNSQPKFWQGVGWQILRQLFGVPAIGRAGGGANQTAPAYKNMGAKE